jgi:Asp/Glu/hydantoin racemase
MTVRIGTVHALTASIAPIEAAFVEAWPEAEVLGLCDESLYADYARWGRETAEITRRVTALLDYSARMGADGILFAGSLFSESVEAARAGMSIPVLTAYEAMVEAAFAAGTRLGLLATVEDTITALERDTARYAEEQGVSFTLESRFVSGAMDALRSGDRSRHNALIAEAAAELEDCQALMLAQHTMGPARHLVKEVPGRQILTSPDAAALKLKRLVTEQT